MDGLDKLTTRLTCGAMARLRAECDRRYRSEARFVPYGSVISELIERHLPEAPAAAKPVQVERGRRKVKVRAA